MATFIGTPSDELPDVLSTGRTDVSIAFVSMSAREPAGRDEEYLAWHFLDHLPEQHRLAGLRGALRLVSTPACRAERAASDERYDAVDHVMTYLFADRDVLTPFRALGAALGAGDRMPLRLPSVALDVHDLAGKVAAPRVVVGSDVVPWRPATGVYLVIEVGSASPERLADIPGVAGVWWFTSAADDGATTQVAYCFLDDDPVATAQRLRPVVEKRWTDENLTPLLAAPFHTVAPFEWGRYLP